MEKWMGSTWNVHVHVPRAPILQEWRKLRHLNFFFFWGGEKKSLEILYNVMQWAVGHDHDQNLVYKGVDFYVQNALKLTYELL